MARSSVAGAGAGRVALSALGVTVAWGLVPLSSGEADVDRMRRRRVAWELVRREARALGAGADLVLDNPCPRCGGPHGPVRVRDSAGAESVRASIAYAGGFAVVAVGPADRVALLGIDAEHVDAAGPESLDRVRPGDPAQVVPRDATRDWVRAEAALKAWGSGIRVDPALVALTPATPDSGWTARLTDAGTPLEVFDLEGPSELVIALACDRAA